MSFKECQKSIILKKDTCKTWVFVLDVKGTMPKNIL
jgi:hypothetical protein